MKKESGPVKIQKLNLTNSKAEINGGDSTNSSNLTSFVERVLNPGVGGGSRQYVTVSGAMKGIKIKRDEYTAIGSMISEFTASDYIALGNYYATREPSPIQVFCCRPLMIILTMGISIIFGQEKMVESDLKKAQCCYEAANYLKIRAGEHTSNPSILLQTSDDYLNHARDVYGEAQETRKSTKVSMLRKIGIFFGFTNIIPKDWQPSTLFKPPSLMAKTDKFIKSLPEGWYADAVQVEEVGKQLTQINTYIASSAEENAKFANNFHIRMTRHSDTRLVESTDSALKDSIKTAGDFAILGVSDAECVEKGVDSLLKKSQRSLEGLLQYGRKRAGHVSKASDADAAVLSYNKYISKPYDILHAKLGDCGALLKGKFEQLDKLRKALEIPFDDTVEASGLSGDTAEQLAQLQAAMSREAVGDFVFQALQGITTLPPGMEVSINEQDVSKFKAVLLRVRGRSSQEDIPSDRALQQDGGLNKCKQSIARKMDPGVAGYVKPKYSEMQDLGVLNNFLEDAANKASAVFDNAQTLKTLYEHDKERWGPIGASKKVFSVRDLPPYDVSKHSELLENFRDSKAGDYLWWAGGLYTDIKNAESYINQDSPGSPGAEAYRKLSSQGQEAYKALNRHANEILQPDVVKKLARYAEEDLQDSLRNLPTFEDPHVRDTNPAEAIERFRASIATISDIDTKLNQMQVLLDKLDKLGKYRHNPDYLQATRQDITARLKANDDRMPELRDQVTGFMEERKGHIRALKVDLKSGPTSDTLQALITESEGLSRVEHLERQLRNRAEKEYNQDTGLWSPAPVRAIDHYNHRSTYRIEQPPAATYYDSVIYVLGKQKEAYDTLAVDRSRFTVESSDTVEGCTRKIDNLRTAYKKQQEISSFYADGVEYVKPDRTNPRPEPLKEESLQEQLTTYATGLKEFVPKNKKERSAHIGKISVFLQVLKGPSLTKAEQRKMRDTIQALQGKLEELQVGNHTELSQPETNVTHGGQSRETVSRQVEQFTLTSVTPEDLTAPPSVSESDIKILHDAVAGYISSKGLRIFSSTKRSERYKAIIMLCNTLSNTQQSTGSTQHNATSAMQSLDSLNKPGVNRMTWIEAIKATSASQPGSRLAQVLDGVLKQLDGNTPPSDRESSRSTVSSQQPQQQRLAATHNPSSGPGRRRF